MNLAGVERVLAMEELMDAMQERMESDAARDARAHRRGAPFLQA